MGQSSKEVFAFAIIFPVISSITVGLRFWTRRKMGQKADWDDYLILVALVDTSCDCSSHQQKSTNVYKFFLIGCDAVPMAISE